MDREAIQHLVDDYAGGRALPRYEESVLARLRRLGSYAAALNCLQSETQAVYSPVLMDLQMRMREVFVRNQLRDLLGFDRDYAFLEQVPAFLKGNAAIHGAIQFFQFAREHQLLDRVRLQPLLGRAGVEEQLRLCDSGDRCASLAEATPFYALRRLECVYLGAQHEALRQLTHMAGDSLGNVLAGDFRRVACLPPGETRQRAPTQGFSVERYFSDASDYEPVVTQRVCVACYRISELDVTRVRFLLQCQQVVNNLGSYVQGQACRRRDQRVGRFYILQLLGQIKLRFELALAQEHTIADIFCSIFSQVQQQKHFIRIADLVARFSCELGGNQLLLLMAELRNTVRDFGRVAEQSNSQCWLTIV